MKLTCLTLFMLLQVFFMPAADTIDHVADLFAKGNTSEIAKLFANNVDMGIMADLDTYPKARAEQILQKFFTQNKPISSKVLHKVTSSAAYNVGVIELTTDKGVFRVSFTLKDNKGVMQLVEVRVEGAK
ncbi:MAG: DUF4783 domain-containing protein [Mucilaginibacter sp.]